jgi:LIM homeobox protein 2/9
MDSQTSLPLSISCQYPTLFGSPSNAPNSPKESNIKLTAVPYFSQHDLQGFPQQPRQKGRPRKRKPKDIETMAASLGKYKFCKFKFLI